MVNSKWNTLILIVITISSSLAVEDSTTEILKVITQDSAEKTLRAQSLARDYFIQLFTSIRNRMVHFNGYNTIIENIIKGLQSRDLDPLKIIRERNFLKYSNETPSLRQIAQIVYSMQGCNEATDYSILRWETVLKIIPELSGSVKPFPFLDIGNPEFDLMDKVNRPFVDLVLLGINEKHFTVSLRLLQSILLTYRFRPYFPDLVVLIKNVNERLESSAFKAFHMETKLQWTGLEQAPNDILKSVLSNIVSREKLEPQFAYQINQLLSALRVNRSPGPPQESESIANWFLAMRNDDYPLDILEARDDLISLVQDHSFMGVDLSVLQQDMRSHSRLEKLLGLLARLLILPLNSTVASRVHAIYPHVKLRYLANMEQSFTPQSTTDVAFLLNSFLTVKNQVNPGLIQQMNEIFLSREFDWNEILKDLDFSKYSRPRTLLMDILKALAISQKLPACDVISIDYFVKSNFDDSCSKRDEKFANILPQKLDGPTTPLVAVSDMDLQSATAAPPIYFHPSTPAIIKNCSEGEQPYRLVDPECLIEIIESKQHAGFIINLIRYNPIYGDKYPYHTRYSVFHAVLDDLKNNKYKDDVSDFVISQAILRLPLNYKANYPPTYIYLCADEIASIELQAPTTLVPPTEQTSNVLVETATFVSDQCQKYVLVVDAASLFEIINPIFEFPSIKRLIFEEPIIYEEYKNWETREQVIKALLENSRNGRNGTELESEIKDFYAKWPITWRGGLPPALSKKCVHQAVPAEDSDSCQPGHSMEVIDVNDLLQIIGDSTQRKRIEMLLEGGTLSASRYRFLSTKADVLKTALLDRNSSNSDLHEVMQAVNQNPNALLPPKTTVICDNEDVRQDQTPSQDTPSTASASTDIYTKYSYTNGTQINSGSTLSSEQVETTAESSAVQEISNEYCASDESLTPIVDTDSLFKALHSSSPRARFIKNRIRSYVIPVKPGNNYTIAEILRDILDTIREEMKDPRVIKNMEILKKYIMYNGVGREAPEIMYACLPNHGDWETSKKPKTPPFRLRECSESACTASEVIVPVIDTDCLFDALKPNSPKDPHVENLVRAYIMPIDNVNIYTKGGVLRDVLKDLLKNTRDINVLKEIATFLENIMDGGPASERPAVVRVCFPKEHLLDGTFQNNASFLHSDQTFNLHALCSLPAASDELAVKGTLTNQSSISSSNTIDMNEIFTAHAPPFASSPRPSSLQSIFTGNSTQTNPFRIPMISPLVNSPALQPFAPQIAVPSEYEQHDALADITMPSMPPGLSPIPASVVKPAAIVAVESMPSVIAPATPSSPNHLLVSSPLPVPTPPSSSSLIHLSAEAVATDSTFLASTPVHAFPALMEPNVATESDAEEISCSTLAESDTSEPEINLFTASTSATTISSFLSSQTLIPSLDVQLDPADAYVAGESVAVPTHESAISDLQTAATPYCPPAAESKSENVVAVAADSSLPMTSALTVIPSSILKTHLLATTPPSNNAAASFSPEPAIEPTTPSYQEELEFLASSSTQSSPTVGSSAMAVHSAASAMSVSMTPFSIPHQPPVTPLAPISIPHQSIAAPTSPISSISVPSQPVVKPTNEPSSSHQSSETISSTSISHQTNASVAHAVAHAAKPDLSIPTSLSQDISEIFLPAGTASNVVGSLCAGVIGAAPSSPSPSSFSPPVLPIVKSPVISLPSIPIPSSAVFQTAEAATEVDASQSSSPVALTMNESVTGSQPAAITMPSFPFSFYSAPSHPAAAVSKLDSPTPASLVIASADAMQPSSMHYNSSESVIVKNTSFSTHHPNSSSLQSNIASDVTVTQVSDSGSPVTMDLPSVVIPTINVPVQHMNTNYAAASAVTTTHKPFWTIPAISHLNKTSSSIASANDNSNAMESQSSMPTYVSKLPTSNIVTPPQQHSNSAELTAFTAFPKIPSSASTLAIEISNTSTTTSFGSVTEPSASQNPVISTHYLGTTLKSPSATEAIMTTFMSPSVSSPAAGIDSLVVSHVPTNAAFSSISAESSPDFPLDVSTSQELSTESSQQSAKVTTSYSDSMPTTMWPHQEAATSQSSGFSEFGTKSLEPESINTYHTSHPQQILTTLPTILGNEKPNGEVKLTDSPASLQAEGIAVETAISAESIPENGTEGMILCPHQEVLTKLISNSNLLKLLPLSPKAVYIRHKINNTLIPANNFINQTNADIIKYILNEILISAKDVRVAAVAKILLNNVRTEESLQKPAFVYRCLSKGHLHLGSRVIIPCDSYDYYKDTNDKNVTREPDFSYVSSAGLSGSGNRTENCSTAAPFVDAKGLSAVLIQEGAEKEHFIFFILQSVDLPWEGYEKFSRKSQLLHFILDEMEAEIRGELSEPSNSSVQLKQLLDSIQMVRKNVVVGGPEDTKPEPIFKCPTHNAHENCSEKPSSEENATEEGKEVFASYAEASEENPMPLLSDPENKDRSSVLEVSKQPKRKIKKTRIIYNSNESIKVIVQMKNSPDGVDDAMEERKSE